MRLMGLDTLGLVFLVIAIAFLLTYVLWEGWRFQFNKRQFGFLIFFLILMGMFFESWLRETGDELLLAVALSLVAFIVIYAGAARRRRARGVQALQ